LAGVLAPILIYGTLFGLTYVLIALGFTLLFGISRVLNVAYGALYMVTAYIIYWLVVEQGYDLLISAVIAVGVAILVGVAIFLLCVRFAPDPLRFLIVSFMFALLLQYMFSYYFHGASGFVIPSLIPIKGILIYGVSVNPVYIVTAGVALVLLFALWAWIEWTSYGHTIRATAEDPETAALFGIRVRQVYLIVVVVSSALVAIAAVLIVPATEVVPTMWIEPFVIAFVVAVIGGLGNFKWTLPAAFLLSFSQETVAFLYPTSQSLTDIVAFVVAICFIAALPHGFGGLLREST